MLAARVAWRGWSFGLISRRAWLCCALQIWPARTDGKRGCFVRESSAFAVGLGDLPVMFLKLSPFVYLIQILRSLQLGFFLHMQDFFFLA